MKSKVCKKCLHKYPVFHKECVRCREGYTDREYIDTEFIYEPVIPRINGVPMYNESREEWQNEQWVKIKMNERE